MAVSTTKNNRTGGGGGGGGGSRPHFFKIILDEALRDGKLFIPAKFLRKYGNNLQNRVILKDPTGTEWPVELTNSDGEIWLDKGFPEFAKFYSLSHGYLIVFQLQIRDDDDDDDCFNIVVFDPTATEIDYPQTQQLPPINPSSVKEEYSTSESELDDDSTSDSESDDDDVQGGESSCLQTRLLSRQSSELDGMSTLPSAKVRRTMISCSDVEGRKSKSSSSELDASAPAKLEKATGENGSDRTRRLGNQEKREAIDRARSAFTTTNPFFMLPVQPSYLSSLPNVAIPIIFAKEHLKNGNGGEAILVRVSDGRKWKVKYSVCCDPGRDKKMKAWFGGSGWKDFVQGNQLAVGDVCAFELTTTTSVNFGVTIFRNYKQPLST